MLKGRTNVACAVMKSIAVPSGNEQQLLFIYCHGHYWRWMGRSGTTRLPVISFSKFMSSRVFSSILRLWEIILRDSNNRSADFAAPWLSKKEICCPRFTELTDFQTQEQKMSKVTEAQRRKTQCVRGADRQCQHVHLSLPMFSSHF